MQIAKAKLKAVKEYLSEVLERVDDKVIIFAHHRLVMDEISELLLKQLPKMGYSFVRIDGGTAPAKRPELVKQFQEPRYLSSTLFPFFFGVSSLELNIRLKGYPAY